MLWPDGCLVHSRVWGCVPPACTGPQCDSTGGHRLIGQVGVRWGIEVTNNRKLRRLNLCTPQSNHSICISFPQCRDQIVHTECVALDWKKCKWITASLGKNALAHEWWEGKRWNDKYCMEKWHNEGTNCSSVPITFRIFSLSLSSDHNTPSVSGSAMFCGTLSPIDTHDPLDTSLLPIYPPWIGKCRRDIDCLDFSTPSCILTHPLLNMQNSIHREPTLILPSNMLTKVALLN